MSEGIFGVMSERARFGIVMLGVMTDFGSWWVGCFVFAGDGQRSGYKVIVPAIGSASPTMFC